MISFARRRPLQRDLSQAYRRPRHRSLGQSHNKHWQRRKSLFSKLRTVPLAHQGWLGALRDEHVGRALAGMHNHPQQAWTVASLADLACMSRSSFAERFTALVGEAPLAHLTRRRMEHATRLLRSTCIPTAEIAGRVGYGSLPAFSRAYKRFNGQPPGAARRQTS